MKSSRTFVRITFVSSSSCLSNVHPGVHHRPAPGGREAGHGAGLRLQWRGIPDGADGGQAGHQAAAGGPAGGPAGGAAGPRAQLWKHSAISNTAVT